MVIKGSIHPKAIIITHIVACNTECKVHQAKTNKLKRKKDDENSIVVIWDFNTQLSVMDRIKR